MNMLVLSCGSSNSAIYSSVDCWLSNVTISVVSQKFLDYNAHSTCLMKKK